MSATETASRTGSMEWLAIALTPGLGPARGRRLVEFFGSAGAVLRAPLTELEAAGIQAMSAQSLSSGKSLELAGEEMTRASAAGAQIITLDDDAYPIHLKQIYDPPLALYVRGDASVLAQPGIAGTSAQKPPSSASWTMALKFMRKLRFNPEDKLPRGLCKEA